MAKVNVEQVEVPVILKKMVPRYTISDLTEAEVITLRDVLMSIGGDPETSRRGHTQNVLNAIYALNLPFEDVKDKVGSIGFASTENLHETDCQRI